MEHHVAYIKIAVCVGLPSDVPGYFGGQKIHQDDVTKLGGIIFQILHSLLILRQACAARDMAGQATLDLNPRALEVPGALWGCLVW